jgi:anti-sigma regulatory factor (Ser/Thr protein kinase)
VSAGARRILRVQGVVMADQAAATALRHMALFYRKRAEYLSAVTGFLRAASDRDEPVLAAVPGERVAGLRQALGARARVSFVDMTDVGRNPAKIIPAIRAFTDRHSGQRVSFLGEPAWPGRSASELVEATRHEALINLAFATTPVSILCPYDAALPASVRDDAGCTHPEIIEGADSRASGGYLGTHGMPPRCDRPLTDPPPGAERLSYESDLRPVRALVAARATGYGLSETRATDLVLAVSEIAANTLRHTSGGGALSVWSATGEILCEVRDTGWIADPLAGRTKPPENPTGQQGLWVVNKVCDLVELRSSRSGTSIRLHMSLASGARAGRSRWPASVPAAISVSPAGPPA